ncbi:hypothetical protein Taro_004663 [Colocasia esculenta]|uniref:NB-ARC domain-containing protein n=1 Tax=Colocasia esculenta TaxID=4460 RepID=A0A843TQQ9_COLES|nr:hypothetical protein [Colocasia esculenta]
MEDIVWRFMKIEKPEQALNLDCRKEQTDAESISARRTTSSFIEEPRIVGRVEELAKIKQFLLSSDAEESRRSDYHLMQKDSELEPVNQFLLSSDAEECTRNDGMDDVPVMAIVGMGGLGKTTLAQLAYNDDQLNQHFQLKSWVCVSEDFDVVRLTKSMLQSLDVEPSGLSELDPLQQKLLQRLSGEERFLLVLDDVWEAENLNINSWNLLTAPLRNRSADSKIIITTRSSKVSEMVARSLTYDLCFLSDEDTLELFMLHAFEGRDPNLHQNLVAAGKATAKKCRGVPLAAKTLGGLLRTKDDEEWNKILDSEVWNATINQEDCIIPILRLSYQHLPAPLKRCFRYCSLFPKDYVFYRNPIIRMWMAQGYIKASRREVMEDIGQRYIDSLLSRSFFQKYPRDPQRLQMHDLMHDLARCVSGDECYSMEINQPCPIPSHVRHLSILPTDHPLWYEPTPALIDISEPTSFRSFLLPDKNACNPISELLSDSYSRLGCLRVLDLRGIDVDRLSESVAHLKHLRYLCISDLVKEVPESVGSLYHLQTLDLGGVSELPNSMSNLHNLRHLILSSSDTIEYPVGIGKLADLQTMPGFRVSPKHNCAKLGELKDMNSIRGKFAIKGLENLADVNEAKEACLDKKRNNSSLHLEWDYRASSSSIDDEVLESLKPSVKLKILQISGFKGPSYPSWLGDGSFSRLGTVKLENCRKWISLPPLGQLPSLRSLIICAARAVEYIGGEFFSGGFPQLEELTLEYLYSWKSWCGAQEGDCPKLKKLSIDRCPNLESLSLNNLGAVEDVSLSISGCPKLLCMPGNYFELSHLQRAKTIKIKNIDQGLCIEARLSPAPPLDDKPQLSLEDVDQREADYMLGMYSHICRLTVERCSNLRYLPLVFQSHICRLTVKRCLYLMSLPLGNQSALKYVEISDCPELRITSVSPQLWQLPSLQRILVNGIQGAVSIKVVRESNAEFTNVDQRVVSFLLKELSHMIRRLVIVRCANLTSLPWTDLTTLEYLTIRECPLFQLLDAEQLPSTLQVFCIYGNNPYETEQCSRHQHFQRLKQVQQCSNKEGT